MNQSDAYPMPLVVVVWDDAVSYPDGSVRPRHVPCRLMSVGFLLEYDRDGISIASELNDDGDGWRDEVFIPDGMIVDVTEIEFKGG